MSTRYHQAATDDYLEILKEATKRDLNLSDEDGMTPTLLAAYHGNLEALEIICSRGGDPDKCDIWGNTPLHCAASNGHTHCVSFLINFGANIFALDNDLQSPLDAAASREQSECVDILDKAARDQSILNPKKVARQKEQAQRNAQKQIKDCEKLQDRHQNKMNRTFNKEKAGTLTSSKGTFSRSSSSNSSTPTVFETFSKGLKDTFKARYKKNRNTADEQVGKGTDKKSRRGQQNVMEVFQEDEEESFTNGFKDKIQLTEDKDNDVQQESIFNRPGLGNIVFKKSSAIEDISDSKREIEFNIVSGLLQKGRPGDIGETNPEAELEEEDGDEVPWNENEMEWEEDEADITPIELFLMSQNLSEFIPILMREQIDLDALLLCSDEDLQSIQMQLGPRKKILSAIGRRKQLLQHPGQMTDTSL
ncbi:ankyrin repeat and SAM domain-containing protein 4B-like [Vombatus ursinus]|uniref:SAM domain-containing protein n=1 Tax=Vombatus ursinus TaxID=29139 RepID=A0A4X2LI06_VOMUR|nr:ankyrin repeat and SAM domain-containing protein 4B-like [Vombatus ursinus]XP_027730142.1 ankyrin repeat and SAM domain-containing protein 4B-like [Vombatus ursinus]